MKKTDVKQLERLLPIRVLLIGDLDKQSVEPTFPPYSIGFHKTSRTAFPNRTGATFGSTPTLIFSRSQLVPSRCQNRFVPNANLRIDDGFVALFRLVVW
jgi:hypothetical protein